MSNTSHQPTTATRVTDPDSDPSRATSYHVTKTPPPCQTKCRPHTQPPPQTAAHRARQKCLIGMAEGQRVVSSPGSPSRSSQRASRPPRTWRSRPTGVLVIDCFSRALSAGCAGWVRPGSWTTRARGLCGRRSRTSAATVTPIPLWRNALQQLAIGCNSTTERLRSAIGMLPTIDYEQTPMVTSHFPADTCCPSQRSAQRPAEAALGRCREPARSTGTSSVHSGAAVAVATLADS